MILSKTISKIINEGKLVMIYKDSISDFTIEIKCRKFNKRISEQIVINNCIPENYIDELIIRSLNRLNDKLNETPF